MADRTLIDRVVEWWSPAQGAARRAARLALEASYSGAVPSRMSTSYTPTQGYVGRNHPLNRWRLTKMRDRSRDLERNNVLAAGLLDRAVENVIGTGMKVQARTADPKFNETVEDLFRDWFDAADVRGMFGAEDLQRIVYRSMLRDGDVGVVLVGDNSDPDYAGLQVIEGHEIDQVYGVQNDPSVVDGIKFDQNLRPIEFNVVRYDAMGKQRGYPVPARDFVYLWRTKMASSMRGEPCFATVFDKFDEIQGYTDAVIVAARVLASQAMLIKAAGAGNAFAGLGTQMGSDATLQRIKKIEPGGIHYLQPGEDVVQPVPNQPAQGFSDFIATLVRLVGISLGMPLEVLLLDFSRTNYSSGRAAIEQLKRSCLPQRQQFKGRFLSRVYQWRLAKWVKSGRLVVPDAIKGNYWKHEWIAPVWASLDPVKDLQAALMATDANLDTLSNIAMQYYGRELDDIFAGRAREMARIRELRLPDVRSNMTRDPLGPAAVANAADGQPPQTDPETGEEITDE